MVGVCSQLVGEFSGRFYMIDAVGELEKVKMARQILLG